MHKITIQNTVAKALTPPNTLLKSWAKKTLENFDAATDITIRIVDTEEMTLLNQTYRNKSGPTNVLSFPLSFPEEIEANMELPIRGDIALCAEVINQQAKEQHKPTVAHWAHLVVHGVLHLLGYDHETPDEAQEMETSEIEILNLLGFANPYDLIKDTHGGS